MSAERPTDRAPDKQSSRQYYRDAVLASHKGVQTFLSLTNELKEKYGLFDYDIEGALKLPKAFLSKVRTGTISHPDYYYNFTSYCTKLSELLSKYTRRELSPRSSPVDTEVFEEFLAYLRASFHERYHEIIAEYRIKDSRLELYRSGTVARIPQNEVEELENAWGRAEECIPTISQPPTKDFELPLSTPRSSIQRESPQLEQKIESMLMWKFPEEWLSLPYKDAIATCTTAFDGAYILGIAKAGNYNITRSAALAGIDRKHFRNLLNKHDGKPQSFEFTSEELSRPFSDLKQEWIDDFKRQYIARAIDQEKTISGASKATGVDRMHLGRMKRRLIDGIIQQ